MTGSAAGFTVLKAVGSSQESQSCWGSWKKTMLWSSREQVPGDYRFLSHGWSWEPPFLSSVPSGLHMLQLFASPQWSGWGETGSCYLVSDWKAQEVNYSLFSKFLQGILVRQSDLLHVEQCWPRWWGNACKMKLLFLPVFHDYSWYLLYSITIPS